MGKVRLSQWSPDGRALACSEGFHATFDVQRRLTPPSMRQVHQGDGHRGLHADHHRCASSRRDTEEMFAIARAMNESTMSSAEMSINTPLAFTCTMRFEESS
jgi:hypothetical protein